MAIMLLAVMFVTILGWGAVRANARFRDQPTLPMQWGLDGQVNWSAPRKLAVAFIPVTGSVVLAFIAGMALNVPPRPGQEGLVLPVLLITGVTLVAVQWLHIALVARTPRRPED